MLDNANIRRRSVPRWFATLESMFVMIVSVVLVLRYPYRFRYPYEFRDPHYRAGFFGKKKKTAP